EEQSSTQSASADCRRRSLNQKHGATLRIGLLNLKDLQTMFPERSEDATSLRTPPFPAFYTWRQK
ncbi:MAG: hypothetical protein ACLQOO_27550, partial [Terriglobia bacterium]